MNTITYWKRKYYSDRDLQRKDICLELDGESVNVEADFLEKIPHLSEIQVSPKVKNIGVTPALERLLQQNDVLIIGFFDTYAEQFAKQHHLKFLHDDIEICRKGEYDKYGIDILTLKFLPQEVIIHNNNICTGSSAGSNGGGEVSEEIPANFYNDKNAVEIIAKNCWGCFANEVRQSQLLKTFITGAKQRKGYYIKY